MKIIYFYHIPKCAGTTIAHVLERIAKFHKGEYHNFDSKKLFKFWVDRSEKYYKNLFKQLNLEKIDQYKYLDNFNVIFIGKKT